MSAPLPSFRIEPSTGLLVNIRQVLSPYFDARPPGVAPSLIIVHGISLPPGEFGGPWIDRLFTGNLPADVHPYFKKLEGWRVSAHVLIRRDGAPVQYVPFGARAWHAGQSEYRGRAGCNDFSIGIELEGTDETPYTDEQYESLAALCAVLIGTYASLSPEEIAGHSDVAPARRSDPGPVFDWTGFRARLAARL